MHLSSPLTLLTSALALAGSALAAPHNTRRSVGATTQNGFPNPDAQQLLAIEKAAHGKLANAPPPPELAQSTLQAFQLILYNEQAETAFFQSVIDNVTANAPGFELPSEAKKAEMLDILNTILNQEMLHAVTARGILTHFNQFTPDPCRYQFPTASLRDAVSFIQTVTSFVMGTLQDAQQLMSNNGDSGPVRAIGSVIGQEGEQNGFFRIILGLSPSSQPFLTTSLAPYAWSLLQTVTVPGSCPFPTSAIDLPIFKPLTVLSGKGGGDVEPKDQLLSFQVDFSGLVGAPTQYVGGNGTGLWVTYLNGQQQPISEPVKNVRWQGELATFDAYFPYAANVMDGLTIAALTTSNNFTGPDAMPAATIAAPGLVTVNNLVNAWDSKGI